jgi:hypothetical protein
MPKRAGDWISEMRLSPRCCSGEQEEPHLARGVGALAAVAEKYSGIAFLDADNWYDRDHTMMTIKPAELPQHEHIDTNCYFFLPRSYYLLHHWCTMPRELAESGDHLFYLLLYHTFPKPAVVPKPTVNYLCMTEQIYLQLGEVPPPGAKPTLDWRDRQAWLDKLPPEELALVKLLTGLDFQQQPAA